MKSYKELLVPTLGIFLSLVSIIALARTFQGLQFAYIDETAEWLPHLIIAVVAGFIGIPLTLKYIDKVGGK